MSEARELNFDWIFTFLIEIEIVVIELTVAVGALVRLFCVRLGGG